MLRVKDSEIQCLKQEICSLKDELQASDRVPYPFAITYPVCVLLKPYLCWFTVMMMSCYFQHSRKLLNELSDLRASFPNVQRRAEAHNPQSSKCGK